MQKRLQASVPDQDSACIRASTALNRETTTSREDKAECFPPQSLCCVFALSIVQSLTSHFFDQSPDARPALSATTLHSMDNAHLLPNFTTTFGPDAMLYDPSSPTLSPTDSDRALAFFDNIGEPARRQETLHFLTQGFAENGPTFGEGMATITDDGVVFDDWLDDGGHAGEDVLDAQGVVEAEAGLAICAEPSR